MKPAVAPIALDYIAGALAADGREVEILDLCFAEDALQALRDYFSGRAVRAVGLTFRNSDDCFWPSAKSFIPRLTEIVAAVRGLTDAPVVIGGAGFSIFPEAILGACGCDYGIVGDGEESFVQFLRALDRGGDFSKVPGLVWRPEQRPTRDPELRIPHSPFRNPPSRPSPVSLAPSRDWVDNRRYFREGGQGSVETKRGCDRPCVYCADALGKGRNLRLRAPEEVAAEIQALLRKGVDVLHLCDSEFNIPPEHALAVCRALIEHGLGARLRWYTYAAVGGFTDELARAMRDAGCAGINFGVDSANAEMLAGYRRSHRKEDISSAVRLCRKHGLRVMLDLLLGGPGETEATLRDTIDFMKEISPDCVGAALGVRIYPGTAFAACVLREGDLRSNPNLRHPKGAQIEGDHPLLSPMFYISEALGPTPAQLVRDIIGGDPRFFEPVDEQRVENYNYNDNLPLVEAIRNGARGAYWDILRGLRAH